MFIAVVVLIFPRHTCMRCLRLTTKNENTYLLLAIFFKIMETYPPLFFLPTNRVQAQHLFI